MAAELGQVEITNFSGGMNTEVADLLLPSSAMRLILNLDADVVGGLRPRRGTTAVGSQVTDNKVCLGLHNFRDSGAGLNNRLISVFNNAGDTHAITSYLNGASWTTVGGGSSFTASAKFRFRTFLDLVFMTNSAHDTPKSWDGDTGSAWGDTQLSGAPAGQFLEVFNDKMHIGSTTDDPDRLFLSSVPDLDGNITWDSEDYLDVRRADGMNMTGLHNNGYYLLVFKERAFYRWNGKSTEANLVYDVGSTAQSSISTRKGITFFFNPYGVFATQGDRPVPLSNSIQRWIDAVDPAYYGEVAAECDENNYYCSIGDVTVDGIDYDNVVLVYSISTQTWRVYTYSEQIRAMSQYTDSSGLFAIVSGNDDGDVWQLNNGNLDNGTDDIPYEVRTGKISLGSFANVKSFQHAFAFAQEMPGAQTFVSTDIIPDPWALMENQGFAAENMAAAIQGRYFDMALRGAARGTRGLFHGWTLVDTGLEGMGSARPGN